MTHLRPMLMSDAEKLLTWKNYQETRRFAIIAKEEISLADHLKWLSDNLKYFRIIEDNGGEPVGAIRITDDKDVSIWIDRNFWGRGIATYVLQHECDRSNWCKIVAGNIGSMRAFIRAGFLPTSFQDGYYIFKKQ